MTFGTTVKQEYDELRQCWRTQRPVFDHLHSIFHFTIDAAASPSNALLPRYWTKEDDCLTQDWSTEVAFCNPPYRDIGPFVAKATTARTAVMLLPITCLCTRYMTTYPARYFVFPNNRMKFVPPDGLDVKVCAPTLATVVVIWGQVEQAQLEALNPEWMRYKRSVQKLY